MNKRWLLAVAMIAVLGGAFALGGATVLAGRNFFTAQLGDTPLIAGTLQQTDTQDDTTTEEKGIVIVRVVPDSPAAQAGLQRGDILMSIDDTETNTLTDVHTAIADKSEGDTVNLSITRGGTPQTLTATLGALDESIFLGIESCGMGRVHASAIPINPEDMGARIAEVVADSPAAEAGLQVGDVITAVNGEALAHPMALGETIATLNVGDTVTLSVRGTDKSEREVEVTLAANPDDATTPYLGVRYEPNFAFGHAWGGMSVEGWQGMPTLPGLPEELLPSLEEGETFSALVVAEVEEGSAAASAGLERGDHITEINGNPVTDLIESDRDVSTIFTNNKPGDSVTLTVLRSGESEPLSITATLGEDEAGNAVLGIQAGFITIMSSSAEGLPFDGVPLPDVNIPAPSLEPAVTDTQA